MGVAGGAGGAASLSLFFPVHNSLRVVPTVAFLCITLLTECPTYPTSAFRTNKLAPPAAPPRAPPCPT